MSTKNRTRYLGYPGLTAEGELFKLEHTPYVDFSKIIYISSLFVIIHMLATYQPVLDLTRLTAWATNPTTIFSVTATTIMFSYYYEKEYKKIVRSGAQRKSSS